MTVPPRPLPEPWLADTLAQRVAELESQNKILRYSQANAESASERFETLFSSVPLPLMVVDEHDMVVQANSMAHRRFQPTEFDRPLVSLMPFVREDHLPKVSQAFALAQHEGQAEATEVVFAIGDSGQLTGDLHVRRLETHQEGAEPLVQYICAVIDQGPLLAERQALQHSASVLQERNEQLYAGERRLEAVINSALDAIICVDKDQRITVFNPTAAALFQCAASDALGSPLERFLPNANEALGFMQVSTQALLGELTARTASGKELSVEVSVSVERHNEGETTTVFARDLTARKKAEAQREVLEAQLRESQKMQAVGTMAGGIAHDFNNILGAILGNVELARGDLSADSPALVSLQEIDKAGRRARELVRQILTFSRNEAPQRQPLCLAEVVHETERLLHVTLPPGIGLRLHLAPHTPPVLADATQVEQALLNLCTNAIHAIGEHRGWVDIQLQALEPDTRKRERLGLQPGTYVRLSVQDSGQGMDAATMERIFEPFFTTKPVGQGTGLGLAVVHGVMRTHDGAADVQSVTGVGSTFSLYFPALSTAIAPSAPPEAAPPPAHAPAPAEGQAPHHVFYVDDDTALVFLVERLLRRRGYRVTTFTDPQLAAEALRANPQACDLLVTDYNMPGFSGVDLLREVRQIRPDLPVALASGYVTTEIERSALAEGARALIHKPNDVEELCATVQRLLLAGPSGPPNAPVDPSPAA
ncbi:response regulator [Curvibacter sp. RS43]|uniref:PAS domain-containing hybrid sensor histidine kinase/response regulator n=1 Tax=Curvibacter microcysteis TaxID=3026419 RepID=UPI00235F5FC7|nr:PAS domain-containing sensor histidine kinase [Curvibacter sp. RS43]MDD0809806.1 response regulator [Curvibacter sp. RS43]